MSHSIESNWYVVDKIGRVLLMGNELAARNRAAEWDLLHPGAAPHVATRLMLVPQAAGIKPKMPTGREIKEEGLSIVLDHARRLLSLIGRKETRDAVLTLAAEACEKVEADMWAAYKGQPPWSSRNPLRGDPHTQGVSDGAGRCAKAIRALIADQ